MSRAGIPNKCTTDVRAVIADFARQYAPDLGKWLNEIADPAKRMDLYLRALEYHVPKLNRTEHTGEDGGPIDHSLTVKGIPPPSNG